MWRRKLGELLRDTERGGGRRWRRRRCKASTFVLVGKDTNEEKQVEERWWTRTQVILWWTKLRSCSHFYFTGVTVCERVRVDGHADDDDLNEDKSAGKEKDECANRRDEIREKGCLRVLEYTHLKSNKSNNNNRRTMKVMVDCFFLLLYIVFLFGCSLEYPFFPALLSFHRSCACVWV